MIQGSPFAQSVMRNANCHKGRDNCSRQYCAARLSLRRHDNPSTRKMTARASCFPIASPLRGRGRASLDRDGRIRLASRCGSRLHRRALGLREHRARARRHSGRVRHWRKCAPRARSYRHERFRRPRCARLRRGRGFLHLPHRRRDSASAAITTVNAASSRQRKSNVSSTPSRAAINADSRSDFSRGTSTLAFGIAAAAIIVDQLGFAVPDHEPGLEHALIGTRRGCAWRPRWAARYAP